MKPRPVSATSIPALTNIMQHEWDSLVLEAFNLKQQLETTRQELSQALYQHDAACRVIARLVKERDAARAALANAQISLSAHGEDSAAAPASTEEAAGITPAILEKIQQKHAELEKKRKKRVSTKDLPSKEEISNYQQISSVNVGIPCTSMAARLNDASTVGPISHAVEILPLSTFVDCCWLREWSRKSGGFRV